MRNKVLYLILLFLIVIPDGFAQCAMCRAALETEEGGVKAEAVNNGIMYLMIFPYLLVGFALYFSYKIYKKKKDN